jgi:hypothetical protein
MKRGTSKEIVRRYEMNIQGKLKTFKRLESEVGIGTKYLSGNISHILLLCF